MKITYGYNHKKEVAGRSDKDWNYGAIKAKGIADDIVGLVTALYAWPWPKNGIYPRAENKINHCVISWIEKLAKYYPKGEVQRGREDYVDCVTRGFVNEIEKCLNYLLAHDKLPASTVYWFNIHKYIVDGKFILSNRIPAIMSGTTRSGNSLKSVVEWIKDHGIHPRALLSEEEKMTWRQYHDRSKITQKMLDTGEASKDVLQINYAKVYKRNWSIFFGRFFYKIFDNYIDSVDGDFVKELARDYRFLSYGYKLILHSHPKEEIKTRELTCDQVRRAYMKRPDLRKEFPAWNKFHSVTKEGYTIYDWARKYGPEEMPEIFNSPEHTTYIYNYIWKWIKGLINK